MSPRRQSRVFREGCCVGGCWAAVGRKGPSRGTQAPALGEGSWEATHTDTQHCCSDPRKWGLGAPALLQKAMGKNLGLVGLQVGAGSGRGCPRVGQESQGLPAVP